MNAKLSQVNGKNIPTLQNQKRNVWRALASQILILGFLMKTKPFIWPDDTNILSTNVTYPAWKCTECDMMQT